MIETIASTPLIRIIVLILTFVGVSVISVLVISRVDSRASVRKELRAIADDRSRSVAESLTQRRDDAWSQLVNKIEKFGLNLGDTRADDLREKLKAAGFTSPAAPRLITSSACLELSSCRLSSSRCCSAAKRFRSSGFT